jgi:1-acyl-sn-glycerol-3-phosphate acyltransferase
MVVSALLVLVMMKLEWPIPRIFLVLGLLNAAVAAYIYTLLPEFLFRFLLWILANVLYRLRVEGDERIPKTGGAVLVCNHVSFVDWMIISAAVKRPVRFIMDHAFAKGLITRYLLKQAKVILIAPLRENPQLLRQAFDQAAQELRDGELVCIFPEGKITKDGKINPFKPGVEKIVRDTPVPVIPMALWGLWGSFFSREGGRAIMKRPKRFWSRVGIRIGEAVPAENASAELLYQRVAELRGGLQ